MIAALVPTVLVLVVVAVIGFYVYERLTRDIVEQRDTELAMITAARLSEGLTPHSQILQNLAVDDDVQSMEPARLIGGRWKRLNSSSSFLILYWFTTTREWPFRRTPLPSSVEGRISPSHPNSKRYAAL